MAEDLSLVRGAVTPPLLEHTIGAALDLAVQRSPDAEALVSIHQGVRWTWAELGRRADALAAGLLALGLRPGDRVGVWGPNSAQWALAQFATARVGLIQVNINPAYRLSEVEYTLNKVGVKALIAAERFKTSDYAGMIETLAPEISGSAPGALSSARLPDLRSLIKIGGEARPGWIDFEAVAGLAGAEQVQQLAKISRHLDRHQPINIQFTSGTTGLPKGATLSHRNILNNAYFVGRAMGLQAGDRLCIPVPLYHCFGMVMGNLACVVHGATMVYPSEGFDALAVLQAVQAERCTALHGVPTMFIAELEHPQFDSFDLSSLRTGIMAGSPCPIEVMRKVIDRMHMREVGIAYGMTETSPVSFQTACDDPLDRRVSTVGRVHPHLEVKVVGGDGAVLQRGQAGELCTRGYSVMLGYWDEPEKTDEAVDAEGWMHTGDLAVIDDEGYGNIVGRIKDMVIRGGENVYPREVEEFLFRHPKVEDVQVVGVPDPRFGEELCAWVKLRTGETATEVEIVDFCRGQIAHYKIPRYVRFVESFPMTVTGKIQKFEIRAAMISELGLAEQATA
ncbi:AMP-binding protein [Phenylobacterium sp. 58.2.17]|uniref:AMP-binding protein n=1 Tax=Phenylobacterium sp. 58.2.17 TaxID=2969306 RepID=UPI0022656DA8|nr:AMP-binding protein [Phenylobacterium sp. 58.2.17]MCX7587355.1 AMP-binding protein [Phenylobacterium sp. 58.2.17]